jgi:hypothetical protein
MHPRIQEVLEFLDTTRADVSNAVESVAPDHRDERPAGDRWSVAEVLEHLSILEARVAQLVSGRLAAARAAGLGPELETSSVLDTVDRARIRDRSHRATAPDFVRPQSTCDAVAAGTALQQSRADLRASVLANDGFALSEVTHEHPVLGLINLYQWLVFVGAHEARHADQIREIAGELA